MFRKLKEKLGGKKDSDEEQLGRSKTPPPHRSVQSEWDGELYNKKGGKRGLFLSKSSGNITKKSLSPIEEMIRDLGDAKDKDYVSFTNNGPLYAVFKKFSQETFVEENLIFLEQCSEFLRNPTRENYNSFIQNANLEAVNLYGRDKKLKDLNETKEDFSASDAIKTVEEARDHVFDGVKIDTFLKFSGFLTGMQKDLDKRENEKLGKKEVKREDYKKLDEYMELWTKGAPHKPKNN